MNRLIRLALAIGLCSILNVASAEQVFRGTFEVEGLVPLQFATVELRDSGGVVKSTAATDVWRTFRPFAASQMQAGDSIVAYGGIWGAQSFAGEFRLLLDGPPTLQNIGVISTLVSTLAGSGQVQGSTPAERLANAVTLLKSFGLIDDDWRQGSPARVNYPVDDAVSAANGIQNWVGTLLAQVQAGEIDDASMATFPYANGGVLDLAIAADAASWLPGDAGQAALQVSHTLAAPPVWVFQALNLPTWMTLSPQGELTFQVPADATPAVLVLEIRVNDPVSNAGRSFSLPFRIENGTVATQAIFNGAGGTLWHPNGNIGVEVPPGAVSEPTTLQWLDYPDAQGETVNLLRVLPIDRVFAQAVRIVFADLGARGTNTSVEDCWAQVGPDHLAPGWFAKMHCQSANFLAVEQKRALGLYWSTLIEENRVARPLEFPLGLPVKARNFLRPASTLTARCGGSNCAGRQPVLFVHGFARDKILGGGAGTWGDLPQLIHDWTSTQNPTRFAAYEFRYRSNARFEDIASDLGHAIDLVYQETGQQKVRIVAHSFGGLVARTYLQGLAGNSPVGSPVTSCLAPSWHPKVESLLTLGTPHSGIADSPQELHSVLMPKGTNSLSGAAIGACGELGWAACGDLSVWQAGAWGPFDDADEQRFTTSYEVADEPGEIIAKLNDFEQNPLPVPALALVGMVNINSSRPADPVSYSGGDGLISYQGQRFSPLLSCSPGSCRDNPIGASPLTSIGGVSGVLIGHCVYDQVLGAARNSQQPVPGTRMGFGPSVARSYRHSTAVPVPGVMAEPLVVEDDHMPGRTPLARHDGSIQDTFNRVLSWVVAGEVEPLERNISVSVVGAGTVEVISGATTLPPCAASNPQSGTPTECLFKTQAQIFVRYVPAPGAQPQLRLPFCDAPDGCELLVGAYQRVRANFTPSNLAGLNLHVLGPGRVTTQGGESCEGDCTFYFTPNSVLTLTRQALPGGIWNQWAGACSGSGVQCQVTLGVANSLRVVSASFSGTALPPPSGVLNDTGINWCANATTNNLTCPQAAFPDQDGDHGRDALARAGQLTKIGGGEAGFDYTKISNSGNQLPASAALGTGTNDWGCTRDNLTGLIWEVKVNNSTSLRHMEHTYTWYDTNSAINGGNAGTIGTAARCNSTLAQCNTSAFVAAVNAQGLCGANDWRMPTPEELQGIVHYGHSIPSIDPGYFPNTEISTNARVAWSGWNLAVDAGSAWALYFLDGSVNWNDKSVNLGVRLVRGGQ